jgi:flap endonuclease-1
MGVRNLNTLIKKCASDSIENVHLTSLDHQNLAVDLQLFLYKFQIQCRDPVKEIYKQIVHLKKYKINPIYVLDGKPPAEKMSELYRRANIRNKSREILECLSNKDINDNNVKERLVELKKNSISISNVLKKRIKLLCEIMNVEFIDNMNMEADKAISILYKTGRISGAISEDNDMLVYGCGYLYRFYKSTSDYVCRISLDKILECLDVTYEQLIDICILSGCDYYKNIKYNVDVKTSFVAYSLIKKYGCIEALDDKNMIPLDMNYNKIREIYIN